MRIASFLVSLLALGSATASAHEADLNAVWVQPVAPAIATAAIVPLGWTHGLAPGMDLVLEATPFYAGDGPPSGCASFPGCRDAVYGLIFSTGLAFNATVVATDGWEIGWFVGPKALAAGARETGNFGGPSSEPPFVPGTAIELGGGLDLGLEFHMRRLGLYAALVIGWQASVVFNYAETDLGGAPPTSPIFLVHEFSTGARGTRFMSGPNLNLLRVGFAF